MAAAANERRRTDENSKMVKLMMIQTCSSTENSRTNDSSAFNSFQLFAFLCISSFELESS